MCYTDWMNSEKSVYTVFGTILPMRPVIASKSDASGKVYIPDEIVSSLWKERLLNRQVKVYRGDELIFNWPARKMRQ